MTDPKHTEPVVTQADRDAAWPFADFHCLPDRQMRERWLTGYYDNLPQGAAIQAFARHRITTTATLTAQVEALTAERDALRRGLAWLRSHIAEVDDDNSYWGGPSRREYMEAPAILKELEAFVIIASTSKGEGHA